MSDVIIRVENLGKQYHIGAMQTAHRYKTFRDALSNVVHAPVSLVKSAVGGRPSAPRDDTIWALKDVSFEVKQGEALGIIGRNGAGKSTLLKVLTRITEPTEGQVEIHGRVGSLLEVGTGFHPELTGRENIYLNGAILGMRRAEIDRRFDEIVAFAEIEQFLDTPVKRYSSGMYVRLAFAVAAHLDTEILLVDEVLAVGDMEFQKKCLGKMGEVSNTGRTVFFVSHNMTAILGLCERVLLIDKGEKISDGLPQQVVQEYTVLNLSNASIGDLNDPAYHTGSGEIRTVRVHFGTRVEPEIGHWVPGEPAVMRLDYECSGNRTYNNTEIAVGIRRLDRTPLLYLGTKVTKENPSSIASTGHSICTIERLPLEPGRYLVSTEIKLNGVIVDKTEATWVDVVEGDFYGTGVIWPYGGFLCDYSWSHFRDISNKETL